MATNLRLLTLNDVKLVGRLTKDPEVRFTTQGTAVCRFRLAVGRRYKSGAEWKDEVAFVPCTVWRESAERCGQRLKKGSPAYVEGRLKSRDWVTKEGQKRFDLELDVQKIQFLESNAETVEVETAASGEDYSQEAAAPAPVAAGAVARESGSDTDSYSNEGEVPF